MIVGVVVWQERERSVRLMESSLQDATERVTEKEASLDARIHEIMRLEARLHQALIEQQQQKQEEAPESTHSSDSTANNRSNTMEEREAALVLQEQVQLCSDPRSIVMHQHIVYHHLAAHACYRLVY